MEKYQHQTLQKKKAQLFYKKLQNKYTRRINLDLSRIKFALQKFKRSIFKRLSKNSVNYFLRGQDKISIEPSVNGVYEPDITELISYFNEIGYCDFLFDIGANIGLTSCQNGLAFDKVFCFEPNPLCLHILKVNTEITLDNINIEINEFG